MGMIDYEVKNRIAFITLNRPERFNAYGKSFFNEMPETWAKFRDDKNALVAIITGAEEKAFCVGYDLESGELSLDELKKSPKIVPTSHNIWKPIIAAIKGYCVAGGFWIASGCDIRIAAEDAEFGIPEAKSNIFSVLNVPEPIYQNLPPAIALELSFLGERISAKRMHEIGFLNRVVSRDKVIDTAIELAEKICRNGQLSITMGKELFYRSRDMSRAQIEELNWKMQGEYLQLQHDSDGVEG
ncbi:MAG TPA: enoyl-CoA hydratase/isomerase family protein [Desulfobacteraceae bacterium]|nr:enoyl-CoA hydratase/isomerase family protein [Desulfobacteraceae bacterium]